MTMMIRMTRKKKAMLCVLLASTGLVAATPTVALSDAPAEDPAPDGLAQQIDIMRLVLARSINKQYASLTEEKNPLPATKAEPAEEAPTVASNTFERAVLARNAAFVANLLTPVTFARTQFTSHTRGFYADGVGVIFSSEVQTPVRAMASGDEPEPREPDEWDAAAREVEGSFPAAEYAAASGAYARALTTTWFSKAAKSARYEIDQDFVEAAIDAVLAMISKHGLKIEDLPDDESIIVALRLTPTGPAMAYPSRDETDPTPSVLATLYNAQSGAHDANARHLTIRVAKRDLGDRASGTAAALRRNAVITSY